MTLRIAFMGTPDFAARSLAEIAASGHEIARVYTQPPRRRGRGQSEQKTPVHQLAEILGIPDNVMQVALLPVAYTKGTDFKRADRPPVANITHWNTW